MMGISYKKIFLFLVLLINPIILLTSNFLKNDLKPSQLTPKLNNLTKQASTNTFFILEASLITYADIFSTIAINDDYDKNIPNNSTFDQKWNSLNEQLIANNTANNAFILDFFNSLGAEEAYKDTLDQLVQHKLITNEAPFEKSFYDLFGWVNNNYYNAGLLDPVAPDFFQFERIENSQNNQKSLAHSEISNTIATPKLNLTLAQSFTNQQVSTDFYNLFYLFCLAETNNLNTGWTSEIIRQFTNFTTKSIFADLSINQYSKIFQQMSSYNDYFFIPTEQNNSFHLQLGTYLNNLFANSYLITNSNFDWTSNPNNQTLIDFERANYLFLFSLCWSTMKTNLINLNTWYGNAMDYQLNYLTQLLYTNQKIYDEIFSNLNSIQDNQTSSPSYFVQLFQKTMDLKVFIFSSANEQIQYSNFWQTINLNLLDLSAKNENKTDIYQYLYVNLNQSITQQITTLLNSLNKTNSFSSLLNSLVSKLGLIFQTYNLSQETILTTNATLLNHLTFRKNDYETLIPELFNNLSQTSSKEPFANQLNKNPIFIHLNQILVQNNFFIPHKNNHKNWTLILVYSSICSMGLLGIIIYIAFYLKKHKQPTSLKNNSTN